MTIDINKLNEVFKTVNKDLDDEGYEVLQYELLRVRDDVNGNGFKIVGDILTELTIVLEQARNQ